MTRCAFVGTLIHWGVILALVAWCASLQVEIRHSSGPVVQDRLKTLEASSTLVQQSLQINCNGNDTFTVLSSNGNFAQARFCLLPNPINVTLPEAFVGAVVYGNTTEIDVMDTSYYHFQGVTSAYVFQPEFYISVGFDRLCGYHAAREYPDNYPWCVPLKNMVCGRSNLIQAQFDTVPNEPGRAIVTVDVELGFSIEACAIFAS